MNLKDCKWGGCCWKNRYEVLGLAFLIIATALTIIAWDSFGIVAMFVVGLVLIGHKHFCYIGCHSRCHSDEESCGKEACSDHGKAAKESTKKKEA